VVRLPVSGAVIALPDPNGADDMLLLETAGSAVEVGLSFLEQVYGRALDAANLVVTDFEYLLLQLRAVHFGQVMTLGFICPHCRELAQVSFRISEYLGDVTPRAVSGVLPHSVLKGWFSLHGAGFRLPTAGDLAAVGRAGILPRFAEAALAERCIDETGRARPLRGRIERTMEAMAPELSRDIAGFCHACRSPVRAPLAVTPLVIGELKRAAGSVHDDVDLIAYAYHWPEAQILSLPQSRRRAYAERARRTRAQAA
jgi:hypothetical protein